MSEYQLVIIDETNAEYSLGIEEVTEDEYSLHTVLEETREFNIGITIDPRNTHVPVATGQNDDLIIKTAGGVYILVQDRWIPATETNYIEPSASKNIKVGSIILDPTKNGEPEHVGQTNMSADYGVPQTKLQGGNVVLQHGMELLAIVRNVTGLDLKNGDPVYISGVSGERATVDFPDISNFEQARRTVGMITEAINNNAAGFLSFFGRLHEYNTSAWEVGDLLYVGPNKTIINTEPTNGPVVFLGIVIRKHATNGIIFTLPDRPKTTAQMHHRTALEKLEIEADERLDKILNALHTKMGTMFSMNYWKGTQAEYDALSTEQKEDPTYIHFII